MSRFPALYPKKCLQLRVKRKLFDDGTDDDEKQVTDDCDLLELPTEISNVRIENQLGNVLLVIAAVVNINDTKCLNELFLTFSKDFLVFHCSPEEVDNQCQKTKFKLIVTDVDLQSNELRNAFQVIRNKSSLNSETPVVAVNQNASGTEPVFGVDEVLYGNFQSDSIQEIITKYSAMDFKIKATIDISDVSSHHQDHDRKDMSECNRQPTTELPSTSTVIYNNNSIPKSMPQYIDVKPFNSNKTTVSRPCRLVRPAIPQRDFTARSHPLHFNMSTMYSNQLKDYGSIKKYAFVSPMLAESIKPKTFHYHPYMISGTPGTAEMKLSYVPEDMTKHSTKERLRRERIKACCDQMRILLPKTSNKKSDMATVFEAACLYMKILQTHTSSVVIEKCGETFKAVMQSQKDNLNRIPVIPLSENLTDRLRNDLTATSSAMNSNKHLGNSACAIAQLLTGKTNIGPTQQSACGNAEQSDQTGINPMPMLPQYQNYVNCAYDGIFHSNPYGQQLSHSGGMVPLNNAILNDVSLTDGGNSYSYYTNYT